MTDRVDAYVKDRVLVVGDAGAVSRPHTGSGATKALQDALLPGTPRTRA